MGAESTCLKPAFANKNQIERFSLKPYTSLALTVALAAMLSVVPSFAETAAKSQSEKKIEAIEAKLDRHIAPSDEDFATLGELTTSEPTNPKVHLVLGLCFEAKGLAKQAFEQYSQAGKLAPNDPKPMVELALARIRVGEDRTFPTDCRSWAQISFRSICAVFARIRCPDK